MCHLARAWANKGLQRALLVSPATVGEQKRSGSTAIAAGAKKVTPVEQAARRRRFVVTHTPALLANLRTAQPNNSTDIIGFQVPLIDECANSMLHTGLDSACISSLDVYVKTCTTKGTGDFNALTTVDSCSPSSICVYPRVQNVSMCTYGHFCTVPPVSNLGVFISGLTQPSSCTYPSHPDYRVWRFELGRRQEVQLTERVSLLGHWSVPLGEGL